MSNREEIPQSIRRMKTSEIVCELISMFIREAAGGAFTLIGVAKLDAMRAELDARIPPREVGQ